MFQLIPFVIFAGVASFISFVFSLVGLSQTLRLFRNGIILSYIGFFVSVSGIFLTVASLVVNITG